MRLNVDAWNVGILLCAFQNEGDQTIAELCCQWSAFAVVAQVSEFICFATVFLFHNCVLLAPLFFFQDSDYCIYKLNQDPGAGYYMPLKSLYLTPTTVLGRGYTRQAVAKALGLPSVVGTIFDTLTASSTSKIPAATMGSTTSTIPSLLPLWACLVGSDATAATPWLQSFHQKLHSLPATRACFHRKGASKNALNPLHVIAAVTTILCQPRRDLRYFILFYFSVC